MSVVFDFSNKHVIVVGGSRGIGKQVCLDFASAGAKVTYVSRNSCNDLDAAGLSHISCDIRDVRHVKKAFDSLEKIDILVNAAAINYCKPINEIDSNEWDEVLEVNLRSYFLTSKLSVEKMKKSGGGKIVNISSIAGRNKSIVSGIHYTSSKAAIIGMTRQLAHEVSQHNICVNVVCPSQTMTDMLRDSMTDEDRESLAQKIPARRLASVEDQSQPILFLCSSAASYITGAALDINGGQL